MKNKKDVRETTRLARIIYINLYTDIPLNFSKQWYCDTL